MNRRHFLALASAAAAFPRVAFAQQAAKVPLVAFVWADSIFSSDIQAVHDGLTDKGYVDGKNIATVTFTAPTATNYAPYIAAALAAKPDIIVVWASTPALVAKGMTATVPIVAVNMTDPVGLNLVASLSHPGGNITGNSFLGPEIVSKQLGIMNEIMPNLKRIVAFNLPGFAAIQLSMDEVGGTAGQMGVEVVYVDFVDGIDIAEQFQQVVAAAPQAIFVPASPYFSLNQDALCDLQVKYKIPLFWPSTGVVARAMVGYGPAALVEARKAGSYVDAILKGTRPADLPVQLPTNVDLVVNLTIAKAIGIAIPPSILAQATQVIQ